MEKFDIWLETAKAELGKWFSEIEVEEQEGSMYIHKSTGVVICTYKVYSNEEQ